MRKCLLFISLFLLAYMGRAEDSFDVQVSTREPIALPAITNTAFKAGEKFKYVIKYQFVAGGYATLEISEGPTVNGRPTFKFESVAKSNKFIDVFFKVRDYNASMVDAASLASISFHQNLREGKYRVVRNTKLDYEKGTYIYDRHYKGRLTTRSGYVDKVYSDILSSFFHARTLPLELGESYYIDVFSDGKTYGLKVDVLKKLKTVRVKAGKFECIRIKPQVLGDGIFKAKEGKMTIWLTNDERRMPVMIRSKIFIGSFDAELVEYTEGT